MNRRPALTLPTGALVALLAAGALPAWAQFKVVGPDGRVTYTDRPTAVTPGSTVAPMRATGGPASTATDPLAGLPPTLRQVAQRFPVTLYTSSDCSPCERARALLRQRGVPYAERSAASDADIQALERLTGGRTVPTLMVGQQALRGLLDTDWQNTLELAGYPATSALPANWQPPPVRPVVTASAAPDNAEALPTRRAAPARAAIEPPRTAPNGTGPDIKF